MTPETESRSISEIVTSATESFIAAGIDTAANDAELITCSVLGLGRTQLYLQGPLGVDEAPDREIAEKVALRSARRPLQHILGRTGFRTIELAIDSRAMIPRPETELLAGAVIEYLERLKPDLADRFREAGSGTRHPLVLDLCTGSGAIALSVAAEVLSSQIWAVDVSREALELARTNSALLDLEERVHFLHGDLWTPIPDELKRKFDVIVANPPYIPTSEIAGLEPEVRNHDPRIALDGGADGLDLTFRILEQARNWMREGGFLAMELGSSQWSQAASQAGRLGLNVLPPGRDFLGIERFFFAAAAKEGPAGQELDSARPNDREAASGVRK